MRTYAASATPPSTVARCAPRPSRSAPGDGWPPQSGGGWQGVALPFVERVSMDSIILDITALPRGSLKAAIGRADRPQPGVDGLPSLPAPSARILTALGKRSIASPLTKTPVVHGARATCGCGSVLLSGGEAIHAEGREGRWCIDQATRLCLSPSQRAGLVWAKSFRASVRPYERYDPAKPGP